MKDSAPLASSLTPRIALALLFLPALVPLLLMYRYGVNIHILDEWSPDMAGLFIKAHHHQLTLADLVSQHAEHRLLFDRLIVFPLAALTHWNNFANLMSGWTIAVATSACFLRLIWETSVDPAETDSFRHWRRFFLRGFVCNVILFTPAQGENWLWGIGLANFLPMALFCPAIMVARSRMKFPIRLALSILLAAAATFTNANGFIAWPAVALLLAWSESKGEFRAKRTGLLILMIAFAAVTTGYFFHYFNPRFSATEHFTPSLGGMFLFFLALLGNPFAQISDSSPALVAVISGAILFGLLLSAVGYFVYAWRNQRYDLCRKMLVWLSIGGFTVLSAMMAAPTRSAMGTRGGILSRYVTYGVYLPIALVSLIPLVCRNLSGGKSPKWRPAIATIPPLFGIALVTAVALTYEPSSVASQQWRGLRRERKAALLMINILPQSPQLREVSFSTPTKFLADADALNEMGYIQPPLIHDPDHAKSRGAIESVRRTDAQHIGVEGWAIFPRERTWADAVFLTYDDANRRPIIFFLGRIGKKCPDIADKFGNSNFLFGGWTATFPLSALPPAPRAIHITAWALNVDTAKAYPLDRAFTIQR